MRIQYIIVLLQIIKKLIKCEYIHGCEVGNYCGSIACSVNGFCNYNLTNYYNQTFSKGGPNLQLNCQCYLGYSSYDIEVQNINNNSLHCCYKKKSQLTAFYLEFFIGFGIGHFYIGNINFGLFKFFIQIFFCLVCWCTMYHSCRKEHTIVINLNDMNNRKENVNFNEIKKNKEINDINEIKEVNEEEDENIENMEKNTFEGDSNNQSFNENDNDEEDNEENKINQLLSENLIKCPISKFFIIFSGIAYFFFHLIDLFFLGFGLHKDKNGEDLILWN